MRREWSILLDEKQEATIHLINHGIDTGKIITALPYKVDQGDTINMIRDKAKIKGIEGLVEVASKPDLGDYDLKENNSHFRQCYILSPAMKKFCSESSIICKKNASTPLSDHLRAEAKT